MLEGDARGWGGCRIEGGLASLRSVAAVTAGVLQGGGAISRGS
jgi:hypothetical protein